MTAKPILPGATLGVLGSGQLGRMFAIEARRLGYGVQVYSPDSQTPAGQVADREWVAHYDDLDALAQFAKQVDVVTLEFENISKCALEQLEKTVPVRPGPFVLETAQNRLREKNALRSFGLPTPRFTAVHNEQELSTSLTDFGGQGVLKTASWGYDGKGQQLIRSFEGLSQIWSPFAGQETILEELVSFTCELSVIAVRSPQGEIRSYSPIVNEHANHILDVSILPSPLLTPTVIERAEEIARTVMESLNVVGVLCVEMFLTTAGDLLINEIAPRPHNSGHLTIDAHDCCQFEQQVRSVCGLPLGSTQLRQPAAMVNLLGDLWNGQTAPDWTKVLATPGVKLHLYGKHEARPGRKMGHLTCLANSAEQAAQCARHAREQLKAI